MVSAVDEGCGINVPYDAMRRRKCYGAPHRLNTVITWCLVRVAFFISLRLIGARIEVSAASFRIVRKYIN